MVTCTNESVVLLQRFHDLDKITEAFHFPGQVVQAHGRSARSRCAGPRPDAEQTKVVVVHRPGRSKKYGTWHFMAHGEPERGAIEVGGCCRISYVQDGMVQALDWHMRTVSSCA